MAKKKNTRIDESGMEHAMWSPSNGHRWIKCPGSVIESQGMKQKPAGQAAKDGTVAHNFGEQMLLGEISLEEIENEEMRSAVEIYDKAVTEIYEEYNNPGFEVESRIDLQHIIPDDSPEEWTCFGSADCIIWDEDNVAPPTIIDFKYGRYLVEVCDNVQLMLYAYGMVTELGYDGPHARVVIVQPRAQHKDGPVRECIVSLKQLKALAKTASNMMISTVYDEPYKAAGAWCKYCVLSSTCDTAKRMTQEIANVDFDEGEFIPKRLDEMSDLQISTVVKYAPAIEDWLAEVKSEAHERAIGGHKYPGLKLIKNNGKRSFKPDMYDTMIEELELPEDEAYKTGPRGIGDIEKLIKQYYEGNPREILADYINKGEGSIALVPDTDGRIEYNPAKSEFDDE